MKYIFKTRQFHVAKNVANYKLSYAKKEKKNKTQGRWIVLVSNPEAPANQGNLVAIIFRFLLVALVVFSDYIFWG